MREYSPIRQRDLDGRRVEKFAVRMEGGRGVPPPRRIGGEGGLREMVFDESTRFVVAGTRYEPTKIGRRWRCHKLVVTCSATTDSLATNNPVYRLPALAANLKET